MIAEDFENFENIEDLNVGDEVENDLTEEQVHIASTEIKNENGDGLHLSGMFKNWFLDYASYVILERAVPNIKDGLKPVQRRILHSMKRMDDGRYNKVANIIGHTMQFHPHGDASIGDALVQLGQKDLLVDSQGNWGNILTGDGAAAPRYIEARLSKFALEVLFNPKTTDWKLSYDGRNKEPETLPSKFPLLLAQGGDGIAVGLSSKIVPHNFNELCDAAISYLKNEEYNLYPDFATGGYIDVDKYNDGARGGSLKIRAKISKLDNRTLVISEIPYGRTSSSIVDSILKANEKGKIKIKRVDDITAQNIEIHIHLAPGVSSDITIDALYAFTDCEISVSPNCCIIEDDKPVFTSVKYVLQRNTDDTLALLKLELKIERDELLENLHFSSLEKVFIEKRMYKTKEFENAENIDEAINHLASKFQKLRLKLIREITREDILKLLEIKMSRILKFNAEKAEEQLLKYQERIKEIDYHLENIIDFTIAWFDMLKNKYGKNFPRKTEIRNFETIDAVKVVEANEKLYINEEHGFIGTSLKKDKFLCNCSSIDDIIIFHKDGRYKIVKVSEKMFVGKDILDVFVFKKNDNRTIYNVVYRDGKKGPYYIKRFPITGITRDKEYNLTKGTVGSKIEYLSRNPNGEAEIIRVTLKNKDITTRKKLIFDKDFSDVIIKGRGTIGNILTKGNVDKVTLLQEGASTLDDRKVWFDKDVLRLNYNGHGEFLGKFSSNDEILVVLKNGDFYTTNFDLSNHFDKDILFIEKFDSNKVWTLIFYDGDKKTDYIKRFSFESSSRKLNILGDNPKSKIHLLSPHKKSIIQFKFKEAFRPNIEIDSETFIGIKSYKARGKKTSNFQVKEYIEISFEKDEEEIEDINTENSILNDISTSDNITSDRIEKNELVSNEKEQMLFDEEDEQTN